MKSLPNILTCLRGGLTIVIAALFFVPFPNQFLFIWALFLLTVLTDFFDGYLARRWKAITKFGIVFDSLFDKILCLVLFLLIAPYNVIPLWILIILLAREIFVDGIKNYLLSEKHPVSSIKTGKWKFTFQIIMIQFALLALALPEMTILDDLSLVSAYIALVLSMWSAYQYTRIFWRFYAGKK